MNEVGKRFINVADSLSEHNIVLGIKINTYISRILSNLKNIIWTFSFPNCSQSDIKDVLSKGIDLNYITEMYMVDGKFQISKLI